MRSEYVILHLTAVSALYYTFTPPHSLGETGCTWVQQLMAFWSSDGEKPLVPIGHLHL